MLSDVLDEAIFVDAVVQRSLPVGPAKSAVHSFLDMPVGPTDYSSNYRGLID
jgi:hypothetical protein